MASGTESRTGRTRLIGGRVTLAVLGALLTVAVAGLWPKSSSGVPTVVLQWENQFLLDGRALSDAEVRLVNRRRSYAIGRVDLAAPLWRGFYAPTLAADC